MRKFVDDRGIDVQWEKSYLCPCRNPMTKAPDPSCPICKGRGVAYLPPHKERLIIQSQEKGVSSQDIGLFDSGSAIGTAELESGITFRDRISVPDVEISQSFIFNLTEDRVKNGMDLVYSVNTIELITTMGGSLTEGVDFTFNKDTNMIFVKEQHLGKNISLNIGTTLRYIVIDLLKESRYQYTHMYSAEGNFENLPKKLLLKREDAFIDSEPFSVDVNTTDSEEKMLDPKREMNATGGFFGGKF